MHCPGSPAPMPGGRWSLAESAAPEYPLRAERSPSPAGLADPGRNDVMSIVMCTESMSVMMS